MEYTMTVQVVKASAPTFWYANKIGQLFTVYEGKMIAGCHELVDESNTASTKFFASKDIKIITCRKGFEYNPYKYAN